LRSRDDRNPEHSVGRAVDQVKITINYPYEIGLPGVSAAGDLTASATERME
jgi:hypothetical protein